MDVNKVNKFVGKFSIISFYAGMIFVGLVFAIFGGIATYGYATNDHEYASIEAKIVETYEIDDRDYGNAEYIVDGVVYNFEGILLDDENVETIIIYYDTNNPSTCMTNPNGDAFTFIFFVIGVGCVVVGIILLIRALKKSTKEMNQLEQVNYDQITEEKINEIREDKEEIEHYYFHFCGKMNQSYILETTERELLASIKLLKFHLFKASKYEFRNNLTGFSKECLVGKTVTYRYGSSNFDIPVQSSFKIDGKDVFEIIGDLGYSVTTNLSGIALNFEVFKYGVKVADLKSAGANVARPGKNYGKLGNIPTQGVFDVYCKESDIDAICLIAFAVSRVEFF